MTVLIARSVLVGVFAIAAIGKLTDRAGVRAEFGGPPRLAAAGSGTVARRAPGRRWQLQPIGFQHFWTGDAYGAGRFVIVGHNGSALVSADTGTIWTAETTATAFNLDAIAWTGREFVAAGQGTAVASPNGMSWRAIAVPSCRSVRALVPYRGHVIGVGDLRAIVRVG
jgi:hypothetical protein